MALWVVGAVINVIGECQRSALSEGQRSRKWPQVCAPRRNRRLH